MGTKTIYKVVGPEGGSAAFQDAGGVGQLVLNGVAAITPVASGSALTISAVHHDKTVFLNTAGGVAITLPASAGTGLHVRFVVSVTATSDYTIACAGTDEFAGVIYQVDTDTADAVKAYPCLAADNFDVITLDGSTTGGLIGDWIEVVDIIAGTWAVTGWTNANGTVATPVSAT